MCAPKSHDLCCSWWHWSQSRVTCLQFQSTLAHSVRMVSHVFLFRSQPRLWAAKKSASQPACPNFWCNHSPSGYHSESIVFSNFIFLFLASSSTCWFQFVAGLFYLAWWMVFFWLCLVIVANPRFSRLGTYLLPNLGLPIGKAIVWLLPIPHRSRHR